MIRLNSNETRKRAIISIVVGLLFISLLVPLKNLLYTEDAINLYFFPFSYGNNPFAAFGPHDGVLTNIYQSYSFYLDSFFYVLESTGLAINIVDRVWIISSIILSNYGILTLLDTVKPSRSQTHALLGVISLFIYWMNPFTLSVTLWHYLAWFVFQAAVPFVFLVLVLIVKNDWHRPLFYNSLLLLTTFFAPALYSSYSMVLILMFAITLIFTIFEREFRLPFRKTGKRVLVIVFALMVIIYFSLLYYLIIYILHLSLNSYIYGALPNGSTLLALFRYESIGSQWYNVLNLTGFLWLHNGSGSYSYPWFNSAYVLKLTGYALPIIFVSGLSLIRRNKIIGLFYALSLVAIIMSVGSNFPFGMLNYYFLRLGGPFNIFLVPYEFMMPIYIITISVVTYLVSAEYLDRYQNNVKGAMGNKKDHFGTWSNIPSNKKYELKKVFFVVVIFAALISISGSSSVASIYGEYNTNTIESDSIHIPNDFFALHNFFQGQSFPHDYYVLVLPLSTFGAYQIQINNGSFPDSSNIFQSLITYPVIDYVFSNQTEMLDNMLVHPKSLSIIPLMESLHIKYIIVNPYVNISYWQFSYMRYSPDGQLINMTLIKSALMASSMARSNVGKFTIFTVPNTRPIADIYTGPDFFKTSNLTNFYYVVSSLNYSNSKLYNLLVNSIPTANSPVTGISLTRHSPSNTYSISYSSKNSYYALSNIGSLFPLSNSTFATFANNTITLAPHEIYILINTTNLSTNFDELNQSFISKNKSYSYLYDKNPFPTDGTTFMGKMSISLSSGGASLFFYLYSEVNNKSLYDMFFLTKLHGNNSIQSQLVYNNITISADTVFLPNNIFNGVPVSFNITYIDGYLTFGLTADSTIYNVTMPVNPLGLPSGPGASMNKTYVNQLSSLRLGFSNYRILMESFNMNDSFTGLGLYELLNFSAVLNVPNGLLNSTIIPPTSYSASKISFSINAHPGVDYAILFSPRTDFVSISSNETHIGLNSLNLQNENGFNLKILSKNTTINLILGPYKAILVSIYVSILISLFLLVVSISLLWYRRHNG